MKSNSPKEIINLLLVNDENCIRSIYERNLYKVIKFVSKNKGIPSDAEEIFQDALYQIIVRAKVKGLEINSSFDAYLFTVCKNLWYKELNNRKKKVRNDAIFELKGDEDRHLESIMYQERWDLFEEMLMKLSGKCKALLKAYFNKVAYNEIVEKFSYANENSAFQGVFKCKKRLAQLIKKDTRYLALK